MKREVGLWIDHHKTVMVTMVNDEEETREIRSNIEKHMRLSGGLQANEPNVSVKSTAEDVVDRRFENHLSEYYDGVISLLRNADSIWMFGPGEAKVELKNRLEREALGDRIITIETVDKMTDRQIAAKVREHFSKY
jgi:hypothetical protein